MFKIIFVIFLYCIWFSNSANILAFYPVPSISHQLYFRHLTLELVKHGHDVTVITTDPALNGMVTRNLREIDVHYESYKLWDKFLSMPRGNSDDVLLQIQMGYDCLADVFVEVLKTEAVKNILKYKNETFDLLLYDGCILSPIIFSHIFKVPAISITSMGAMFGTYEAIGTVINDAYYPSILQKISTNQLEKIIEILKYCYRNLVFTQYIEKKQNEAVKKAFYDGVPDIRDLKSNINMMFINLYSAWDWYRPVPMSFKYTGGLHSISEKPLPKDIKSYLDSSTNGVIYMSFGTNVMASTLPKEKMQMFAKVLSELPYDVLWKWDVMDPIAKKPNIKVFKWLPQSDVLRHPKIKLFITQGGLQSTDEAIAAGVPLIGIPMLGDQWFNTEKFERYQIGKQLDFSTITEDEFRCAIETVIGNQSFYDNIIHHRDLMYDQPQKVIDHAIYWIEHVIRHGGSHLRAPAANISLAEYMELELIAIVLSILVVCIVMINIALKYALNILFIAVGISNKAKKDL